MEKLDLVGSIVKEEGEKGKEAYYIKTDDGNKLILPSKVSRKMAKFVDKKVTLSAKGVTGDEGFEIKSVMKVKPVGEDSTEKKKKKKKKKKKAAEE